MGRPGCEDRRKSRPLHGEMLVRTSRPWRPNEHSMTTRRDFLRHSSFGAAGLLLGPARLGLLARCAGPPNVEGGLRVVTLRGKPRERGRIHGESLKEEIRQASERLREEFRPPVGTGVSDHVARFVADTAFQHAIEKWTPDLLEEVKGIAEASGLPFETVFAMQLPDEQWWYSGNARIRTLPEDAEKRATEEGSECSVVGASRSAGAPALVGQNLDLPSSWAGGRVVLRFRDNESDLESLVVTDPGFVGMNRMRNVLPSSESQKPSTFTAWQPSHANWPSTATSVNGFAAFGVSTPNVTSTKS